MKIASDYLTFTRSFLLLPGQLHEFPPSSSQLHEFPSSSSQLHVFPPSYRPASSTVNGSLREPVIPMSNSFSLGFGCLTGNVAVQAATCPDLRCMCDCVPLRKLLKDVMSSTVGCPPFVPFCSQIYALGGYNIYTSMRFIILRLGFTLWACTLQCHYRWVCMV